VDGPRADFSGLLRPKITHLNLSTQTASWVRSFPLTVRQTRSAFDPPARRAHVVGQSRSATFRVSTAHQQGHEKRFRSGIHCAVDLSRFRVLGHCWSIDSTAREAKCERGAAGTANAGEVVPDDIGCLYRFE